MSRVRAPFALIITAFLAIGIFTGASVAPGQVPDKQETDGAAKPEFVGSQKCAQCHPAQFKDWQSSQHATAMQEANADTVLARFDGATFDRSGAVSTFFQKAGKFWIKTQGPGGTVEDYPVRYTFGVAPLQQYLIELPGGRLQAFGIAWDTRPEKDGGQRWFDLYPGQDLKPGNPLHWTGIDQNWNYQCAFCHSTNLKKNYDASARSFATQWSEIHVGCEACHGPASQHVAWQSKQGDWTSLEAANKSFEGRFDERKAATWIMSGSATAKRSTARTTQKEIETCAACHARRQQFADPDGASAIKLYDAFHPSPLDRGLYHADGQQRDEVYNYGSFLQSRMHAAGVTCSDCHDPHTGKTRRPGNELCGQCHSPDKFDTPAHHHHAAGTAGAECANCHMPTTTYMIVDPRRDHSIRIPRPDLSYYLGTPNACTNCHADKGSKWAADAVKGWYPDPKPGFQTFARAFDIADRGAPGAESELVGIIGDTSQPAIARASAIARLRSYLSQDSLQVVTRALADGDASVRLAAVGILADVPPQMRLELLRPLLIDETAAVRADSARALAGEPEQYFTDADRKPFESALDEYVKAQRFNAERPEQQTNLANLFLDRGNSDAAVAAATEAMTLDPTFAPAFVTLAEIHRTTGDEKAAEAALRDGLTKNPRSPDILHALGLSLVRQQRKQEAIEPLTAAARIAPGVPRYSYVAAVALHDGGRPNDALEILRTGLVHSPYDRDLLQTLAIYELEMGQPAPAIEHAERLQKLAPNSREIQDLVARAKRMAR